MSKTVEIQIEKSRGLVEGLRRHVKEMGKKKTLKGYYPQERWMDYGVPDKR